VPSKRPLLVALALLAACSGDDDDGDAGSTTVPTGGCPVAAGVVAEAVAHRVVVDREVSSDRSCTYLAEGDAAGGRVEVVVRSLVNDGFGTVLADVEREAGPTIGLPDGLVDGADRGWIAVVGRAVQLGAADDETLVVVAVADPLLDADAAQEVAAELAEAALST